MEKENYKKNKTWDGDGHATIHHLENGGCEIFAKNSDNKSLGKRSFNVLPNFEEVISLGTFEIELDEKVSGSQESQEEAPRKPVLKRVSPVPTTTENATNQFKKLHLLLMLKDLLPEEQCMMTILVQFHYHHLLARQYLSR